ncbi:MAG TPA: recombinase family protein [Allosphingosinicella sp.]|jgi:DNA invertase Pin-like site-specific DNA recombinase
MNRRTHAPAERQVIRCAIYTRKSTEEGLEQEFNSLDAQREACAAYILSQRHEGWLQLDEFYDDGGYSGGNMDRPALKRLLAEVEAGKVDVIVLYKVDRLTRSLADFARIVEVLDRAGASFVSVTQSFNTTTSMGRLTLNVLLSFAQFEREVTGERIRDKIAASKAKGMWMGGVVPLGYDVRERRLVANDTEAAVVRTIYERYVELGSMGDLADELARRGVVSKSRQYRDGRAVGGQAFTRGALAHLIKNHVYVGEVAHRGNIYPGEHSAIIDRDLWERAQARIAANRRERRTTTRATETSILAGMIFDGLGRPMSPTHATKGSRRYRYYVSRSADANDQHRVWRLPARSIERLVIERMSEMLIEGTELTNRLVQPSGETLEMIRLRSAELGTHLKTAPAHLARETLSQLRLSVRVEDEKIEVEAEPQALLAQILGRDAAWLDVGLQDQAKVRVTVAVQLKRRGQELRLVFRTRDNVGLVQRDETLLELIARAHEARDTLLSREAISAEQRPHLTRLARLTYLAPDMLAAIVEGRHPADLSARTLLRAARLPSAWDAQREALSFL